MRAVETTDVLLETEEGPLRLPLPPAGLMQPGATVGRRRRGLTVRATTPPGQPKKKKTREPRLPGVSFGHSRPAHHRVRFNQSRGPVGLSAPVRPGGRALCFHLSLLASSGSSVAPAAGHAPRVIGPSRPCRDRFRLGFTSCGGGGRFLCLKDRPATRALSRGKVERKCYEVLLHLPRVARAQQPRRGRPSPSSP